MTTHTQHNTNIYSTLFTLPSNKYVPIDAKTMLSSGGEIRAMLRDLDETSVEGVPTAQSPGGARVQHDRPAELSGSSELPGFSQER